MCNTFESKMPVISQDRVPLLPQEPDRPFALTVEIPILTALFASAITDSVTYNMLLLRTCRNDLHYNSSYCDQLNAVNKSAEAKVLEMEVEAKTTLLVMTMSIVSGLAPAALSLFLGPWSDKHGRKPLVVWPLFGQMLSAALVVVYSGCDYLGSWWLAVCAVPAAALGGSTTLSLGASLILTDVTGNNNRCFRLAVLQGCGFMGALLGSVCSSYLLSAIGYINLYTLATSVYAMSCVYAARCVDESLTNVTEGTFLNIFDLSLLNEMMVVCFKRRRRRRTAVALCLLISAAGLSMFCVAGVANMDYFFTRQKFQWLLKEYTIFSAANTVIIVLGLFVGMACLQNVCQCSDGVMLILAYMSSISEAVVRCFAKKSWHMYLAGVMSMLGGLSPPLIRSQVARVVPRDEVGKLYALMSCTEAILPVFSPLLFNTLYWETLATFPAAIYAVSASCFTVCLIMVIIAEFLLYKEKITK